MEEAKPDIYFKRKMLQHGDLSSSGGSVESDPLFFPHSNIGNIPTPTMDIPVASPMSELDRLQLDFNSVRRAEPEVVNLIYLTIREYQIIILDSKESVY